MNNLVSLGLLVFIFRISAAQVLELNDANFLETVTGHPLILVEFYSPTCPFCQQFTPVYDRAAKQLHDEQPLVQVAKVDCTDKASNVTCTKSSVRYVPWLVFFNNGAQINSFGDRKRDEETIVEFVKDSVNKTSGTEKQQDVTVTKVPPLNACDQHPPQSVAAPATITEGLPVTQLTDVTFPDFIKSSPYTIVDYYAPWCSDCQRLSPLYDEAALQQTKTNPKIKFAKVDCTQGNAATAVICGASKLKFLPWMALFHDGQVIQHYDKENVPDTATIYNFIKSGLQPNDGGSVVQQLDDSSFDSMVSSHPYVLVDFYAPWCFYCKKMAPIYDDVATELKAAYPAVRLVKVDCTSTNTKTKAICTKNDIAFLPTLKLFHNGKFVKDYEGDKTSKTTISSFITDAVDTETASKRTTNSTQKNDDDEAEKHKNLDRASKSDEDEEGSSDDKDDDEEDKNSHNKKKISKETHTKKKTVLKKASKGNFRMDRAARILKKVFKQFKHDKQTKKTKHKQTEKNDEDDHDDNSNQWQQVVKDIHQAAKDIHKMSKEFHKAVSRKQPAVDRLVKAFSHLVKSKDDDEDEF